MSVVGQVLYIALTCFLVVVVVLEATYTVTDPPLKLLRRFIPPLRLGGVALDLSFFVLMIIVYILISVVSRL
jgi:YggT family protein